MRKAVRARTRRTASRNIVDLRHQQVRTGIAQVHRKEEGSARNLIAPIIRHTGIMPELSERRNAFRFSALRLLTQIFCPLAP
jgi:hypothetical protein